MPRMATTNEGGTTSPRSDEIAYGSIIGSGKERYYVTKEGDTLEAIAAFFYGDPKQRQRLLDDNPSLMLEGDALRAGKQIAVSEDAARGDAIPDSTSPSDLASSGAGDIKFTSA
jgi:hypothetical protein